MSSHEPGKEGRFGLRSGIRNFKEVAQDSSWSKHVLAELYPRIRPDSSAPRFEIVTRIEASDQRAVFNRTEERGGAELEAPGTSIVHKVEIPLSGLAPGEHLLEVRARNLANENEVSRRALIEIF